MPTPAKDRFMESIHENVNALEFSCLVLSQDFPKFNSAYLTHAMKIITGMVQRIRRHLIVNHVDLKSSLPKGVLKHGEKRHTEKQKRKAGRR